jgi:hypothetical protein
VIPADRSASRSARDKRRRSAQERRWRAMNGPVVITHRQADDTDNDEVATDG